MRRRTYLICICLIIITACQHVQPGLVDGWYTCSRVVDGDTIELANVRVDDGAAVGNLVFGDRCVDVVMLEFNQGAAGVIGSSSADEWEDDWACG